MLTVPPRKPLTEDPKMIEVNNLTRYYGGFAAVKGVSFRVDDGEIIGVLGLNGAGKSTTLKVLAGLIPPSGGTVTIGGVDVVGAPDSLKKSIGYLPENPPLYTDMTVSGFLRHIGQLRGMTAAAVERRLPEVLKLVALEDRANQVIGTLSHGYRKRVGIAQAVIHEPKLLILDEPISGLDPEQIKEMRQVIRNLRAGRVVLVSSHILSEISQTCDKIMVLHKGELKAMGTEDELARRAGPGTLDITVRGAREGLAKLLESHGLVQSVSWQPAADGLAKARVQLAGDQRERLLHDIVTAGFGLRLVEDPADELEEFFLQIIHGGAA
jgi:ABC-2 type transport system ATP-binding protein